MTLEEILRDPEFTPFVRRWFFDQLTAGQLSPAMARDTARRLDMDLDGPGYALALLDLPLHRSDAADFFSDPAAGVRSALLGYFLKYSEYELFPCGPELAAVLIQGDRRLPGLIRRCEDTVRTQFEQGGIQNWHLAVSSPFSRLEELPDRWEEVSRLWAWRYLLPEQHILRPGAAALPPAPGDERALLDADPDRTDPAPLDAFLKTGRQEDAAAFAAEYLSGLHGALAFQPFRHYILLGGYFAARRSLQALGLSPELLSARLGPWTEPAGPDDVPRAIERLLLSALALRDQVTGADRPGPLGTALGYIHSHLADPGLSLTAAAASAGRTPSYLSALFRREMGCTFTEYVTEKRLALARRLLLSTDMPAGQVALAAGFRDGHYFSALFKKHAGCSPTEFRSRKEDG